MSLRLAAREVRPPMWAMAAPVFYLGACALAVRAHVLDPSVDVGVSGLLMAVGLPPCFAVPAVFATRGATLETDGELLRIDGRAVKFDAIKVEPTTRGQGRVRVTMRAGDVRVFEVEDVREANRFVAQMPPVSAPAGALAV